MFIYENNVYLYCSSTVGFIRKFSISIHIYKITTYYNVERNAACKLLVTIPWNALMTHT